MWDPGKALPLNTNLPDSVSVLSPLALDILSNMYDFFHASHRHVLQNFSTTFSEPSSFRPRYWVEHLYVLYRNLVMRGLKPRSRDPLFYDH